MKRYIFEMVTILHKHDDMGRESDDTTKLR